MLQRTSGLLAVVLLCGVGQAGVSLRADEPVKTGEERDTLLYVRTDPPGAKVLLNGKELGTSNGLFHVEPGTGSILVELQGCKPGQRPVVIRANAVTRVELELKPSAEAAVEAKTARTHFIAHLPQGTVELVGVTDAYRPTVPSRWWRPDGSPAEIGPFSTQQKYQFPSVMADDKIFTFLVRIENLPADASWDPVCGISTSTTPQGPEGGSRNWVPGKGPTEGFPTQFPIGAPLWEATAVYDVLDAQGVLTRSNARPSRRAGESWAETYAPCYKVFPMALAGSASTTDLRVGVSMGAWETVITQKPDRADKSSFSRDGQQWTVTFEKAKALHNAAAGVATQVTLNSMYTYGQWTKRLVAVATNGSEQATSIGHNSSGDNGVAVFQGLALSSIKEFRLQVRPYHWVEFDNVALQYGPKTDVKVVSCDGPVKAEK
jgi:hypothetical protein